MVEIAASHKEAKYITLQTHYDLQLMSVLGRRIAQVLGEARETRLLFQLCSILLQCFNAILLHDSLPH